MTNLYERSRADGTPDWTEGTGFGALWEHVADDLRFHRGAGFKLTNRATGKTGPIRKLSELEAAARQQLDASPEMTVIQIRAESDGFALVLRRDHVPPDDKGVRFADLLATETGLAYLWSGVMPGPTDCSGLVMWGLNRMGIDGIPHNASQQHALFGNRAGFVTISRAQLQKGDLVFIDQLRHVATYWGPDYHGHPAVIDTEPHDTVAPGGWPTPNLGTGVRIRPMDGNYYCARIVSCGRITALNGKP